MIIGTLIQNGNTSHLKGSSAGVDIRRAPERLIIATQGKREVIPGVEVTATETFYLSHDEANTLAMSIGPFNQRELELLCAMWTASGPQLAEGSDNHLHDKAVAFLQRMNDRISF